MKILYAFVTIIMVGCASTGVVPMDDDLYIIAKRSAQVGFGPPDGIKADVYKEANEFCFKENQQVETIDLQVIDSGFFRPGNVSLTFRCE